MQPLTYYLNTHYHTQHESKPNKFQGGCNH